MTKTAQNIFRSSNYVTHTKAMFAKLHAISEFFMLPLRWFGQSFAYIIQPSPGAYKDYKIRSFFVRLLALVPFVSLLPLTLISVFLGLPLRFIDHKYRPKINYWCTSVDKEENYVLPSSLQIATYNVGFVPATMGIIGDLRDAKIRAAEIGQYILDDKMQPDVICFQETFHEDANYILFNKLHEQYPYIIHNVAPNINGFNSGAAIVSKYSLNNIKFQTFAGMVTPDKIAPRGILSAEIAVNNNGKQAIVRFYNVHTQSLLGKDRAQARKQQLETLTQVITDDKLVANSENFYQIVTGDLNTSRITVWHEDNLQPVGQEEQNVLEYLNNEFYDPFFIDHHFNGERKSGVPMYLDTDKQHLKLDKLSEPPGSWYYGPFAKRGALLTYKNNRDRKGQPAPQVMSDLPLPKALCWGTNFWSQSGRLFTNAKFDYILAPQKECANQNLVITEEIRNIAGNQYSASSDHGLLQAKIVLQ